MQSLKEAFINLKAKGNYLKTINLKTKWWGLLIGLWTHRRACLWELRLFLFPQETLSSLLLRAAPLAQACTPNSHCRQVLSPVLKSSGFQLSVTHLPGRTLLHSEDKEPTAMWLLGS